MAEPMKRLWVVEVERSAIARVLAWAETRDEAEDLIHDEGAEEIVDMFSDNYREYISARPAPIQGGKLVAHHHMGLADPIYGDQGGDEILAREAIAIETGNIAALPEHLAALVLKRKEANNGQLPLIP